MLFWIIYIFAFAVLAWVLIYGSYVGIKHRIKNTQQKKERQVKKTTESSSNAAQTNRSSGSNMQNPCAHDDIDGNLEHTPKTDTVPQNIIQNKSVLVPIQDESVSPTKETPQKGTTTLPVTPIVDSFGAFSVKRKDRILTSKRKLYLSEANILLNGFSVYHTQDSIRIVFCFKDYGVCDIQRVGFSLFVTSEGQKYTYQPTATSVFYTDNSCFEIKIIDLQEMSIDWVDIQINWILYKGIPLEDRYQSKIPITGKFVRPTRADIERMRKIDEGRSGCLGRAHVWELYDELVPAFTKLKTDIALAKSLPLVSDECEKSTIESDGEVLLVPISCYFDKGFYSAFYFAKNYPIVEKRFSPGKSCVQCVIAVDKSHLAVLMFLYYCTISQRNYFQYLTDEQIELQQFLEENHPVMRLEKTLRSLELQYHEADIVKNAKPYTDASSTIAAFYEQLHATREFAYTDLHQKKQTRRKWVNEIKLFVLVKSLFPDAKYQYTDEWLDRQLLDIYIPSINCAIEYQGQQHYQAIDFFGGEEKLAEQTLMDEMKREKCHKHGVSLLEWPYLLEIRLQNVQTFLREFAPTIFDDAKAEMQVAALPGDTLASFLSALSSRKKPAPKQRPRRKEVRKYDALGNYLASYPSIEEAALHEGLSRGGISKVLYGERKTAGGFQWRSCDIATPNDNISAI